MNIRIEEERVVCLVKKSWRRDGERGGRGEMYGGKREKGGRGKEVIEKKKGEKKRNREKGGKEEKTEKLI